MILACVTLLQSGMRSGAWKKDQVRGSAPTYTLHSVCMARSKADRRCLCSIVAWYMWHMREIARALNDRSMGALFV